MSKKHLFFALILSNFCNHYSFTMDNHAPMGNLAIGNEDDAERAAHAQSWSAMLDDDNLAIGNEEDEKRDAHDQFWSAILDDDDRATGKSSSENDKECATLDQWRNAMLYDDIQPPHDDEFWRAVKADDHDTVKEFIENKWIDKNYMVPDTKQSLLYVAVSYNSFKVVKYLIAIGANINTTPNHPLACAMENCWNIDIKIVRRLIEKGADLKFIKPGTKKTFLHCAVDTYHGIDQLKKAKIKYFLDQLFIRLGPDEALKIIQAKDINNKTAADYALTKDHKEISTLIKNFEKYVQEKAQEKTTATKTN